MPSLDPVIRVAWAPAAGRGRRPRVLPDSLRDRILSLSYTDKVSGTDKLDLTLDNSDLALFDEPRLAHGNKLHVRWGYAHDLGPTRVMTIKSVKGWRTLRVEGEASDELRAVAAQRTRSWEASTEFEVAEAIARAMGYTDESSRDIRPPEGWEEVRRDIHQAGETDMAFLQRLAARLDCHWYLAGEKFHFHPPNADQRPARTLKYWDDEEGVFAGEPSITDGTLGLPGRVTRRSHSPRSRRRVTASAGNETDTARTVLGEESPLQDPGEATALSEAERAASADDEYLFRWLQGRENMSIMEPVQDQVEAGTDGTEAGARARARARFRRGERKAIELSLPLIGLTWLRADMVVRVEFGIEKLDGNYLVEEVVHKVDGSYTCQVKAKRNARSRSSSGAARSREQRQAQAVRIRANIERLGEQYARGQITTEAYDRRRAQWQARLEALRLERQGEQGLESTGRQNTGDSRPDGELEAILGTDEETGGQRVTWARREAEGDVAESWWDDTPRQSVWED